MLARLLRPFARSTSTSTTAAMSSANAPDPLPTYVYKILETAKTNPRYLFPVPIPASHEFVLPPLDEKDGFVHLSSARQLPGTLNRFFKDHDEVTLLKIDYKRLSGFKKVVWEKTSSGEAFPHLYGYLEGENVESFKEVRRGSGSEKLPGWDEALDSLKQEGWLVY